MANTNRKKGLTTFGWLLVAGAGAFLFSNKERREKVLNAVKGFTDRFTPSATADAPAQS